MSSSKPIIQMSRVFCSYAPCLHILYVPEGSSTGPWFCCEAHMESQISIDTHNALPANGSEITDLFNDNGGALMRIDQETKLIKKLVADITSKEGGTKS